LTRILDGTIFEDLLRHRSCHPLVGEVPRHRCSETSKNNLQPPRVTSSLFRTYGGHPASYPTQKGRRMDFVHPPRLTDVRYIVDQPLQAYQSLAVSRVGPDLPATAMMLKMIEVLHSSCSRAARIMHSSVVKDFGSPISGSVARHSQGEEDFTVLKSPCEQISL
jgi:hypothetical protein